MNYYEHLANIMRALAHPARLEILAILARQPACVNTLVSLSGHRQANISQQRSLLRKAGLVSYSMMGRRSRYALARPLIMQLIVASRRYLESNLLEYLQETIENGKFPITWYGIPLNQIEWHPTFVLERCASYGLGVTTCDQKVFAIDYKRDTPGVVSPDLPNCLLCMPAW